MKLSQVFTLPLLASRVVAIGPTSLASAIRTTVSKANIPGALAITAEKSAEFTTETLPQVIVQGAKWVAANPGAATAYGAAGVGLVVVAAPSVVAVPALGAVGFGPGGVVAGAFLLPIIRGYTS